MKRSGLLITIHFFLSRSLTSSNCLGAAVLPVPTMNTGDFLSRESCLIEFEIALYLPLQGILFHRDAPAVGCHLCPPCRIPQKVADGGAESSHILGRNQAAGHTA